MYKLSRAGHSISDTTAQAAMANLTIMAFFFVMRSCKHTTTRKQFRTKMLGIGHTVHVANKLFPTTPNPFYLHTL
jgi:hypothetical protein